MISSLAMLPMCNGAQADAPHFVQGAFVAATPVSIGVPLDTIQEDVALPNPQMILSIRTSKKHTPYRVKWSIDMDGEAGGFRLYFDGEVPFLESSRDDLGFLSKLVVHPDYDAIETAKMYPARLRSNWINLTLHEVSPELGNIQIQFESEADLVIF